ncbi:hypothetical protein DFR70_1011118 [Nocardia tenerifensis]|uniref:Uncharacterized protein n=1 Tax=Nocardia tenerifensis TaxID=228006 RepID=A0A318L0P1_9NOCA|nr:hypothetical protein [Nocardia tenerifensis]PXX71684.1 hypothetical protein DFR70_1011118 [Nocardia tenerifensis]
MTATNSLGHHVVGIGIEPTTLRAKTALDGRITQGVTTIPATVARHGAELLAGVRSNDGTRDARDHRADIVERIGDAELVPLADTYYPTDYLVGRLLAALRAELIERSGPISGAVIAYPSGWTRSQRDRLALAADCGGFSEVELIPAAEAASMTPTADDYACGTGPLLLLDLGRDGGISLLDRKATRYRLRRHARLRDLVARGVFATDDTESGEAGESIIVFAKYFLRQSDCTVEALGDVRAIGVDPRDHGLLSSLARFVGGPVHVPSQPDQAIVDGATRRALTRYPAAADSDETAVHFRLGHLADLREQRGDDGAAAELRAMGDAIYESRFDMGDSAGRPGALADLLDRADALLSKYREPTREENHGRQFTRRGRG